MSEELKEETGTAVADPEKEYDKAWEEDKDSKKDKDKGEEGSEEQGLSDHQDDEQTPGEEKEPEETGETEEPGLAAENEELKKKLESSEKAFKDTKVYSTRLSMEMAELKNTLGKYEKGEVTGDDVDAAKKAVQDAQVNLDEASKKALEDYPELKHVLEPLIGNYKELKNKISAMEEGKAEETENNKRVELKKHFEENIKPDVIKVHSDFDSILTDPNQNYFKWAEKQSPAMQVAAMGSQDPQDIIHAVTAYKKYLASPEAEELKNKETQLKQTKIQNAKTLRGGSSQLPQTQKSKKDKSDYNAGWEEEPDT